MEISIPGASTPPMYSPSAEMSHAVESARPVDPDGQGAGAPGSVARGRIEVQFTGAREAVGRLFALAQALTNDYDRFEDLVGGGGGASA